MAAPIRLGVIGLSASPGAWAPILLTPILNGFPVSSKYRITALCTTNEQSASTAATTFGEKLGYSIKAYHGPDGCKQIAQDADVDVVLCIVHVTRHKEAILPALQEGKSVFVEWPLGRNFDEANELVKLARSKAIKLTAVGNQGVQSPIVKKIAEAIKSGQIGRVISTTVVLNCNQELGFWGPWIAEKSLVLTEADNGATLLDIQGGHFLACFVEALGEDFASVTSVMATRFPDYQVTPASGESPTSDKTFKRTCEDNIAVSGTLKSGAVVSLHLRSGLSTTKPGRTPFVWLIDGTEGTIKVEDDDPGTASFIHIRHPSLFINGEKIIFDPAPLDFIHNINAEWEEIAKGDDGRFATFEDALKIHKIIDAVRTSAKEGRRVEIV